MSAIMLLCCCVIYFNLGVCEVEWIIIKVEKIDQKMPKAKSTLRVPYLSNEDQGK